MACMKLQPCLLLLYRHLLLCQFFFFFIQSTSCSSSTGGRNLLQTSSSPPASNVQAFFHSNAIPAFPNSPPSPPPPGPGSAPSPPSPPDSGGGASGSSVAKAVVGTFFATLAVSCLIFFAFYKFDRKRRRKGKQDADRNTNPYSYYNTNNTNNNNNNNNGGGGGDGGDDVTGLIVDENGLDVFYWRKLEEGGANLCSYCRTALNCSSPSRYSTQYDDDDDEQEVGKHQQNGRHGGRRSGRRKNQATPLLPVGSVRSDSSAISSQPHPPTLPLPPPTTPRSPSSIKTAEAVAAAPLPPLKPSTATPPPRASAAAPPPPPPPPRAGQPPPPPPALPKRAGPPPPPGPKKGPPPPPPPAPGGKQPMSTPRPPPVPPGGQGGPTKRSQLPPPAKLRPLHWDKMTTANVEHSMVWDKIPSDGSFRFDDELMVALFGTAAKNRNPNDTTAHNRTGSGGADGQASQQQQIVLLDPRKSQNVAIVLRSLAIGRQTIVDALLDGHGLAGDTVEKLSNAPRPTKDEEALVLGFSDDPSKLADAESFLYDLLRSVPSPFDRLDAMLFRSTFDHEVTHVKDSLLVLESACKAIKGSAVFPKLLAAVLKAGNLMNAGTARGDAQAFNLASLRKLSDVKSTNGKTTLLHFLVEEVVRSEGKRCVANKITAATTTSSSTKEEKEREYMMLGLPVIGGLSAEFASVKKAALIDHDTLLGSCKALETRLKDLTRIVNNAGGVGEFEKEMRGFLESSEKELAVVREEKERVLELVKRTTEYYVVGASKDRNFTPLQLFMIVKDFLTMVDQVCIDVARNLQQQQQLQKRLQQQQQQKQQQQQEQTNNATESSSAAETMSDQSPPDSGALSSPSALGRKSPVRFPNFPDHFLRKSSSDSGSDSDDDFAN